MDEDMPQVLLEDDPPIPNDFGAFFNDDDDIPLGRLLQEIRSGEANIPSSSSNVNTVNQEEPMALAQKRIAQSIAAFHDRTSTSTGNSDSGLTIRRMFEKEVTENDLTNSRFYIPVEGQKEAPEASGVVDTYGRWWTMKLIRGVLYNEEEGQVQEDYYEIEDWKAFTEYYRLKAGDKILLDKFSNVTHPLFIVGFVRKERANKPIVPTTTTIPSTNTAAVQAPAPVLVQQNRAIAGPSNYSGPAFFSSGFLGSNFNTNSGPSRFLGSNYNTRSGPSGFLGSNLNTSSGPSEFLGSNYNTISGPSGFLGSNFNTSSRPFGFLGFLGSNYNTRSGPSGSNFNTVQQRAIVPLQQQQQQLVDHNRPSTSTTVAAAGVISSASPIMIREQQLVFEKELTNNDIVSDCLHINPEIIKHRVFLSAAIRHGRSKDTIMIQESGDGHWWELELVPVIGYDWNYEFYELVNGWSRFVEDKKLKEGDKICFYKPGGDVRENQFILTIEKAAAAADSVTDEEEQ